MMGAIGHCSTQICADIKWFTWLSNEGGDSNERNVGNAEWKYVLYWLYNHYLEHLFIYWMTGYVCIIKNVDTRAGSFENIPDDIIVDNFILMQRRHILNGLLSFCAINNTPTIECLFYID